MKRIGWVLLIAGYLAIIGQIADHDPPAKTFAIRFIGAVPKDQVMRSDEVRRQMQELAIGIQDRRPWIFLPVTLMLVGALILYCHVPTDRKDTAE